MRKSWEDMSKEERDEHLLSRSLSSWTNFYVLVVALKIAAFPIALAISLYFFRTYYKHPLFLLGMWLGCAWTGFFLFHVRRNARLFYGVSEVIAAGVAMGVGLWRLDSQPSYASAITLLGAIYILVRGLDSIDSQCPELFGKKIADQ